MQRPRRSVLTCIAAGLLALGVLRWLLTLRWNLPAAPASPAALSAVPPHSAASAAIAGCPRGRFVTINAAGRLGNKLCQYASFWSLQLEDTRAQPAWILPEMHDALSPPFSGLSLPTLPRICVQHYSSSFWTVSYHKFGNVEDLGPADVPLLLSDNPCDLRRFNRHRQALFQQLAFRAEVLQEAQRRLRQHTAALCRGPPHCTYVAVHVRRTDYKAYLGQMYNSTLVGEQYLTRALELCRRRYPRPVFVVCSDDLPWVRQRQLGPDVVIAGSTGADSPGRDMALLAQCNHTVVTHGTYGYMSAFLAQGDIMAPTGFGERDAFLTYHMKASGLNLTVVPAF